MSARRTVLLVINDLARAGAETQLVELALALDPARWDVRVALLKSRNDFADRLAAASIPVTALGRRGFWDLGVAQRLARLVREVRPDVVHSWLFLSNLVSALVVPRSRGPRLVLAQRCSYEATAGPVLRRLARWSHARADRVTVNSRAALEEEVAAGTPRAHLVYIPNAVAPRATSQPPLDAPPGPIVLAVGQLEHMKGHHVLVLAWARAIAGGAPGTLVLLGDGPRRETLEDMARELGIADRVLMPGFGDPGPWLAAASVLVQPSVTEGMPNAVLEGMAAGLPVVASRVGGIKDAVLEGETGLLVPPDDPAALARALRSVLDDGTLRQRLGEAGARRARGDFGIAPVRDAAERLYLELLSGSGHS